MNRRRHLLFAVALVAALNSAASAISTTAGAGGKRGSNAESAVAGFRPPAAPPDDQFGDMVRLGEKIFTDTQDDATAYVGNGLTCGNCHLDRGRLANSVPMWGAYVLYPKYRRKDDKVDTIEDRIADCFRFSMNGTPPPQGRAPMTALVSYFRWLATGAPVGTKLEGQGYPALAEPPAKPSRDRGQHVFTSNCALCHGENGEGRKVGDRYVFPPLWGAESYNWGAGMHRVNTAAAFIKANMPLGRGGTLSDQDAWDVAAFVNSHERPQDPRFTGDVQETREKYHRDNDFYGQTVNGAVLGSPQNIPRK